MCQTTTVLQGKVGSVDLGRYSAIMLTTFLVPE